MERSFLIIFVCFVLNSCNMELSRDRRLKIYNNSNKILYYTYERDTIITHNPITLDSIVYENNKAFYYGIIQDDLIKPHEIKDLYLNGSWEEYLKMCKNGLISIFIYSEQDVLKYPFEKLNLNKKYLKRFDLSIIDLKKNKWIIEYNEK